MADDDVEIKFGADTSDLESGVNRAKRAINEASSGVKDLGQEGEKAGATLAESINGWTEGLASALGPLSDLKGAVGEFAEFAAAAFAVDMLKDFIEKMGEAGEQTERTSKILGISTEDVGRLSYQFAITGTSAERLNFMMGRFEVGLERAAATGTGPVAEGLHQLGLSADELVGKGIPEQLQIIADAVSSFADGPEKTAALQNLGRGFVELIPLLDQGSAGLKKFADQADATGTVTDEATTTSLVTMEQGFIDLGKAIEGLSQMAFTPFIADVTAAIAIMRDLVQQMSESEKEGGLLHGTFVLMADEISAIETQLIQWIALFKDLAAAWQFVKDTVSQGSGFDAAMANAGSYGDPEEDRTSRAGDMTTARQTQELIQQQKALILSYGDTKTAAESFGEAVAKNHEEAANAVKALTGDVGALAGAYAGDLLSGKTTLLVPAADTSELGKLTLQIDAAREKLDQLKGSATAAGGAWPNQNITFGNAGPFSAQTGPNDGLTDNLKSAMDKLATTFGAYTVTSTTQGGHAPGSEHYSGNAVDVSTRGMSDAQYAQLLTDAIAAGFTGIGISGTHAHLDVRPGGTQVFPDQPGDAGALIHGQTPAAWSAQLASAGAGTGTANAGGSADLQAQQALLSDLVAKRQELIDKQNGGNALQKQQNADLIAEAAGRQSVVTLRKADLEAAQAVVDQDAKLGITGEKYTKDVGEAAKAKKELLDATNKQAEAEQMLVVAQAKQTGNAAAIRDAELKLNEIKRQAAGQDAAALAQVAAQKLTIENAYNSAVRGETDATAQAEIDAASRTAKAKESALDAALKMHQISMQQWLQGTDSALEQENNAVTAAYNQELANAGLTSQQKIEIARREADQLAQIALEEQQAQQKASEQSAQSWQNVFNSINSAIDGQIDGLLKGTTTISQALKNIGASLVESLAKWGINQLLTKLEGGLQGLFGGAGGAVGAAGGGAQTLLAPLTAATAALGFNSTSTAANTVATTLGTTAGTTNTIATAANTGGTLLNTTTAAVNTAATTANTLPTAALAAPTLANTVATIANTVATDLGSVFHIPFLASGTPMVAQTGLAYIHKGEAVIPAEHNPFGTRGGSVGPGGGAQGGGGGSVAIHPTTMINISAHDGASMQQWWKNNSSDMMKGIDEAVRHGAHLGMRRLAY